jgi:hypothetical protein
MDLFAYKDRVCYCGRCVITEQVLIGLIRERIIVVMRDC